MIVDDIQGYCPFPMYIWIKTSTYIDFLISSINSVRVRRSALKEPSITLVIVLLFFLHTTHRYTVMHHLDHHTNPSSIQIFHKTIDNLIRHAFFYMQTESKNIYDSRSGAGRVLIKPYTLIRY